MWHHITAPKFENSNKVMQIISNVTPEERISATYVQSGAETKEEATL